MNCSEAEGRGVFSFCEREARAKSDAVPCRPTRAASY